MTDEKPAHGTDDVSGVETGEDFGGGESKPFAEKTDNLSASHEPQSWQCGSLGGRSRQTGLFCKNAKGYKTPHPGRGFCGFHGGNAPNHVRKYQLEDAERLVTTYGLPRDISPEQAIIEEIQRSAGAVEWLEGIVRGMAPEDLVWGVAEAKQLADTDMESLRDSNKPLYELVHKAGASAWLTLYQRERDHLSKLAIQAVKAGLEERKVQMAERQGLQIASVLKAFAVEVGLNSEQLLRAPAALQRALDMAMGKHKAIEGDVL